MRLPQSWGPWAGEEGEKREGQEGLAAGGASSLPPTV